MMSSSGADEISPADTLGASEIQVGLSVVGANGESVGHVKALRKSDFLVDRPLARDVDVPLSSVLATENRADPVRGRPTQRDQVIEIISAPPSRRPALA